MYSVDWSATGTMLQGIGTIIGAVAVIIAAVVGNNTFNSWRQQQLFQRRMDLADRILTLAVRAKEEIQFIRAPIKFSSELDEAGTTLEANGFEKSKFDQAKWRQLENAQTTLIRVNRFQSTWTELQSIKHSAYVYFGKKVSDPIETILHQVHLIRIDADAYAEDNGSDREFTKKLLNTLSRGRPKGQIDELGNKIDQAVLQIEWELQSLLRDAARVTQKAFAKAPAKKPKTSLRA